MSSENVTSEGGSGEALSVGDVLSGLKSVANKVRSPGMPERPYATEDLELPAEVELSEHWQKLDTALAQAQVHAQALLDDWDQQQHVATVFVRRSMTVPGLPITNLPPWAQHG